MYHASTFRVADAHARVEHDKEGDEQEAFIMLQLNLSQADHKGWAQSREQEEQGLWERADWRHKRQMVTTR